MIDFAGFGNKAKSFCLYAKCFTVSDNDHAFLLLLINIHSYFLESDLVGIYTASYILTSGSVVQRSFKPTKTSFWNISLFKYSPAASTLENPCKT